MCDIVCQQEVKFMSGIAKVCLALVIVGALNWLLVGLFNFDLVAAIFGAQSVLARAVYVIVGLCGICCVTLLFAPTVSAARSEVRRVA
jgi:uncharacterized membrane protein YuzA (DUF378 family)